MNASKIGLGWVAFLDTACSDRQIDGLHEAKENFNLVGTFRLFGAHTRQTNYLKPLSKSSLSYEQGKQRQATF
jgi:hypothetical protein